MPKTVLITGGCSSGKSRYAEELARTNGRRIAYIATAQVFDTEMANRVTNHRARRGAEWFTVEEPLNLAVALESVYGKCDAVLVDCITIWLSNLLLEREEQLAIAEAELLKLVDLLMEQLMKMSVPVFLVTNEVGMGIVPESRLGRLFRDIAGKANQRLAAAANEVWLVVSGIPVKIK